ncbi:MAG: acylphosphatase [Euryarchaeota archaeon]|nr:acylphosphatase [Euryarchaeota archaeon]
MERIRAHVFFSGRVQGVFFRAFTKENAEKLGVNGWVRNLSDGRVEAVFEGPKDKVEKLIYLCRYEHPHARVDDVVINYGKPEGISGFKIKY